MLKSAFSLIFGFLVAFIIPDASSVAYADTQQVVNPFYPPAIYPIPPAVSYSYITLDMPGAANTNANGINETSQVVGSYLGASGLTHGFIYSGGSYSTLDPPGSTYTSAQGINASGQIMGTYQDVKGTTRSFSFIGGNYTTLTASGATYTYANGISSNGQIVGSYVDTSGVTHGFLYSGGNYTTLNMPSANYTSALGISSSGQVVGGYSYDPNTSSGKAAFGFIYNAGIYTTLTPSGASSTNPIGINDNGQVVGSYWDASNNVVSFFYSGGNYTTLNMPGSTYTSAQGINAYGQVVGWYDDACGTMRSFVYSGGNYTTLAVPGATQTSPGGINVNGQVAGYYIDSNQKRHGFLATPNYTPAPVPSIYQNCNQIAISLDPGSYQGANGDWWFVAYAPSSGHWYSYTYPRQWRDIGMDLSQITPAYQGPLAKTTNLTLFNTNGISSGTYYVYFGVDTNMNGVLDMNQLYYTEYTLTLP